ncbi:hypothetical protein OB2597_11181 [Pseudooceanicola batsensis HTCC2597]|uniref:DUF1643 domain-containing protein n=1 Tax=Pseudooceanicola batsensis (strain ATCC BAA-863 / DSM 15984 / KCTC 12145 / HTCC2597) TaxID=252305 RepID=A3TW06_PSEBH|nr:DUF1643 domain-containing protein [Pseudooceanicola batsensis]EAQ03802.1 hypothetical protein OB2597_11181 [Pseudooceanicola batsensis HTCC2597]
MIERTFQKGDAASAAVYSECELYRYALTRVWEPSGRRVLFIMLNPSVATEIQNDPTVERCERRARVLGYGGFRVVNIFAFRATDPKVLKRAPAPIGPENDRTICDGVAWAEDVIAGWGAHGAHLGRGAAVAAMLGRLGCQAMHLGLSKQGHPRHPLYIAYTRQPEIWVDHALAPQDA